MGQIYCRIRLIKLHEKLRQSGPTKFFVLRYSQYYTIFAIFKKVLLLFLELKKIMIKVRTKVVFNISKYVKIIMLAVDLKRFFLTKTSNLRYFLFFICNLLKIEGWTAKTNLEFVFNESTSCLEICCPGVQTIFCVQV